MGRPVRIHYPGLIYHVLNRGNNRQVVFVEDDDYRHYLEILQRYKEKFDFKIFAYCLMTNHIHLLLQVSPKASISKIMQAITIAHTRYYHYKYQCSGHIWQGRFKSPLVSSDEYLLTAMRYVEQNPLRAKMVERIEDYPWTSFHAHIQSKADNLVDREENPVYNSLGADSEARRQAYKRFASTLLEEEKVSEIRDSLLGRCHYISDRLQAEIKERLAKKRARGRPRSGTGPSARP